MTLIVGDGTWYFNRASFTAESPKAIAWSVVSMFCADALHCGASKMVLAFDGPKVFRYKLWPAYKLGRKHKDVTITELEEALKNRKRALALASVVPKSRDIYNNLPLLLEYLTQLGIPWVQPPDSEADDVLCSAAWTISTPVVLAAPDKDIYQALVAGPHVRILSTKMKDGKMKRSYVKDADVLKAWSVPANQMVDLQTLIGDLTDSVLPIMSKGKAVKGLTTHGSIRSWVAADPEFKTWLQNRKAHYELNKALVTLRKDLALPSNMTVVPNKKVKAPKSYSEFCAAQNRTSLF